MIDNSDVFPEALAALLKMYDDDSEFQECINFDSKSTSHGVGEKEKMFILEEVAAIYLAAKGKLNFNNRFVPGTEKWVLHIYPGKPLKSEVYVFKKNPLKLNNPKNVYENAYYDLTARKLYNYLDIDMDTFNFIDESHI
jgi:hypothetical protein